MKAIVDDPRGFIWDIDITTDEPLTKEDLDWLKSGKPFERGIFTNMYNGKVWIWDTKMPTGRWLENTDIGILEDGKGEHITGIKALISLPRSNE